MQVVVYGQAINYHQSGKGACVVLVHGWGDSLAGFSDLEATLAKKFKIISLDLPGFGQSQAISRGWDLADYSISLANFVAKLELDVYAYIGHSNGGAILIYGLAKGKLTAKKLVLLASAGIRNQAKAKKSLLKITAKSGKTLSSVLPKEWQQSIRGRFYDVIGSDMMLLPSMQSTFKKIVNHDVQADAAQLNTPTLLIYGVEDKLTPIDHAKTFNHLIKGSRLELIDSAGHFVHQDQPGQTTKLIEEFLK